MKILKDKDVFANPEHPEPDKWKERQTVKIIIENDKGEIALVTNPFHKMFLLPGGGAESNDLEKEAEREALEETRCFVAIKEKIANLEEFRNRNAKHYSTTCFSAKVAKESKKDLRTEKEKQNGLETRWFSREEVLQIMEKQLEKVKKGEIGFYNTAFDAVRDYNFLNHFNFQKSKSNS